MTRFGKHRLEGSRPGPGGGSAAGIGERICDVRPESHNESYVKCVRITDLNSHPTF